MVRDLPSCRAALHRLRSGVLGVLAVPMLSAAIAVACSSKAAGPASAGDHDGGKLGLPDGGYTLANCPSAGGVNAACAACVEESCASQTAAVDSACAGTFACACPLGVDGAACAPTADCASAVTTLLLGCVACDSPCGTDGGAARDGGVLGDGSLEAGS